MQFRSPPPLPNISFAQKDLAISRGGKRRQQRKNEPLGRHRWLSACETWFPADRRSSASRIISGCGLLRNQEQQPDKQRIIYEVACACARTLSLRTLLRIFPARAGRASVLRSWSPRSVGLKCGRGRSGALELNICQSAMIPSRSARLLY